MTIEVWIEGFLVTGMEGRPEGASLLIRGEFANFDEAVKEYTEQSQLAQYFTKHPDGRWTYWGCRLFDNEKDARKSFG